MESDEIFPIIQQLHHSYPPQRRRVKLLEHAEEFATQIGIMPHCWEWPQILQFIYDWDKSNEFSVKSDTVKNKLSALRDLFASYGWSFIINNPIELREYTKLYLRYRFSRGHREVPIEQAPLMEPSEARQIVLELLLDPETTTWQRQLKLVRILTLSFSMIGGCRVADLGHIRWHNIFEKDFNGHPVIVCHMDWSKTDHLGSFYVSTDHFMPRETLASL